MSTTDEATPASEPDHRSRNPVFDGFVRGYARILGIVSPPVENPQEADSGE